MSRFFMVHCIHQTIKTSRPKADKPLSSRHRVKLHGIVH